MVAVADSITEAAKRIDEAIRQGVVGDLHHRQDIGSAESIAKTMQKLQDLQQQV